jgi:hypothetical protein|tara:strand:+ start:683 stop:856 length:174 start_codon:yes stop_codon:yes gene_type:complete
MSMPTNSTCAFCGIVYDGWGNNGHPLVSGRVCDKCNQAVIVTRMMLLQGVGIMEEEE